MAHSSVTLIRNGRIITAVDDYLADVLLQDGRVHTIGRDIQVGPDRGVSFRCGTVPWQHIDPPQELARGKVKSGRLRPSGQTKKQLPFSDSRHTK